MMFFSRAPGGSFPFLQGESEDHMSHELARQRGCKLEMFIVSMLMSLMSFTSLSLLSQ